MIDYSPFLKKIEDLGATAWADNLSVQLMERLDPTQHGDLIHWTTALGQLPSVTPSLVELDRDTVRVGRESDCSTTERQALRETLQTFMPWRKGPFSLFGIHIDTEWRSDWKWRRLQDEIAPLAGRAVLDVGCGSGYHCWRMEGAGAELVIGIDPFLLYVMQYWVLQHWLKSTRMVVLPLGVEDLPPKLNCFDTVFSMGVLYHQRSPFDHLYDLRDCLRPGGELVLETLIIDGGLGQVLTPEKRYAKMRNVWFIPSVPTLELWLRRCGFKNIRCVDVTPTTTDEQRATPWMTFESLPDFLDPHDTRRTIEGYPAPRRAILIANSPR